LRETIRSGRCFYLQAPPFDADAVIVFLSDARGHRRSNPAMFRLRYLPLLLLPFLVLAAPISGDEAPKQTSRTALQPFNDLIGSWRGTGEPSQGTREEKQRNFWQETIRWEWHIKGDDAWLKLDLEKGKYFTSGELRALPQPNSYRLILKTVGGETQAFDGTLKEKRLTLERLDEKTKTTQRLVISLLHSNRYLLRYETKGADQFAYTPVWMVGATKEGVAFAGGDDKPECVVSGGLGTMPVMYKGKTYYVCCGGCRDAFRDEPEKYIREYEERQAAKKKNP
jgi:hypothetical protein